MQETTAQYGFSVSAPIPNNALIRQDVAQKRAKKPVGVISYPTAKTNLEAFLRERIEIRRAATPAEAAEAAEATHVSDMPNNRTNVGTDWKRFKHVANRLAAVTRAHNFQEKQLDSVDSLLDELTALRYRHTPIAPVTPVNDLAPIPTATETTEKTTEKGCFEGNKTPYIGIGRTVKDLAHIVVGLTVKAFRQLHATNEKAYLSYHNGRERTFKLVTNTASLRTSLNKFLPRSDKQRGKASFRGQNGLYQQLIDLGVVKSKYNLDGVGNTDDNGANVVLIVNLEAVFGYKQIIFPENTLSVLSVQQAPENDPKNDTPLAKKTPNFPTQSIENQGVNGKSCMTQDSRKTTPLNTFTLSNTKYNNFHLSSENSSVLYDEKKENKEKTEVAAPSADIIKAKGQTSHTPPPQSPPTAAPSASPKVAPKVGDKMAGLGGAKEVPNGLPNDIWEKIQAVAQQLANVLLSRVYTPEMWQSDRVRLNKNTILSSLPPGHLPILEKQLCEIVQRESHYHPTLHETAQHLCAAIDRHAQYVAKNGLDVYSPIQFCNLEYKHNLLSIATQLREGYGKQTSEAKQTAKTKKATLLPKHATGQRNEIEWILKKGLAVTHLDKLLQKWGEQPIADAVNYIVYKMRRGFAPQIGVVAYFLGVVGRMESAEYIEKKATEERALHRNGIKYGTPKPKTAKAILSNAKNNAPNAQKQPLDAQITAWATKQRVELQANDAQIIAQYIERIVLKANPNTNVEMQVFEYLKNWHTGVGRKNFMHKLRALDSNNI